MYLLSSERDDELSVARDDAISTEACLKAGSPSQKLLRKQAGKLVKYTLCRRLLRQHPARALSRHIYSLILTVGFYKEHIS